MNKLSFKETYFKFLLYLAVVILINIAGITLFFRTDLTQNKLYSLSSASIDVVSTLSEPLTIKVFFSKNLPAPHNNTERYLRDLLEEYASRAGKYFNFTFYDVSSEDDGLNQNSDENKKMARNYGISPIQIRIMEKDEFKSKNAYMGLAIIHGDLIEKIPAITSTDGLEYTLTTAIQKLNNKVSALLRLEEKIKVTLYLSSSLNAIAPYINLNQLPQMSGNINILMDKINQKSMGKIDYNLIDISDKKELETVSKKYDLMALNWPAIPDKNITSGQGAAGLVIQYQDKAKTLPLINVIDLPIIGRTYQITDAESLEETITATIEKMIGINKNIGYLADHGALSLMPDRMAMMQGQDGGGIQVFNHLVSQRYEIKPINLKEETVPQGLNCLIIARPTEKFSDFELFQIDQALMNGTNIAFISDAFNEVMPQQAGPFGMPPSYDPIDSGLEKLLEYYGIKINPAYVLDKSCYTHNRPQQQGGGEQAIYFAPMLKENSINNKPGYMKNIKGLVAMQISPVELIKENMTRHDITAERLLSSSKESWLMKGNIQLNPMFITPPADQDDFDTYDLAYMLQGKFKSFFKGKELPVKESGEAEAGDGKETEDKADAVSESALAEVSSENTFLEESKPVKIFVLPCSQMLEDNMLDPEGRSTNATFLLNIIDHLNSQDSIAEMRSKQQTLNPLAETTGSIRSIVKIFNVAVLPCLVILFGFGIWIKRSARKRKIKTLFSK